MACACCWARGGGSAYAITCGGGEGGPLEAGSPPQIPFPVPWFAGGGGIAVLATSVLWISVLLVSALLVSALATTALDVSGTSGRTGGMALVMGVAGWGGPAAASFIC